VASDSAPLCRLPPCSAVPLVYDLDANLKPIKHPLSINPLSGYYLGDQEAVRARIEGVKAQTGKK
jgi:2,3-bisphosphoglycerate-dependent phosphoglycerate mutase